MIWLSVLAGSMVIFSLYWFVMAKAVLELPVFIPVGLRSVAGFYLIGVMFLYAFSGIFLLFRKRYARKLALIACLLGIVSIALLALAFHLTLFVGIKAFEKASWHEIEEYVFNQKILRSSPAQATVAFLMPQFFPMIHKAARYLHINIGIIEGAGALYIFLVFVFVRRSRYLRGMRHER